MSVIADYAQLYETEIRPRRRGLRHLGVLCVWAGLFLIRPRLAFSIWRGASLTISAQKFYPQAGDLGRPPSPG